MTTPEIISLISLIATVIIGGLTLFWLRRYTEETIALRKIAEQQQENQTSPVLVLSISEEHSQRFVQVKNVSPHPAFNVQLDPISIPGAHTAKFITVPFLAAGEACAIESLSDSAFQHQPFGRRGHAIAIIEGIKPASVVVRCRALSTRTHLFTWTVVPPTGMGTLVFEFKDREIQ